MYYYGIGVSLRDNFIECHFFFKSTLHETKMGFLMSNL